MEQTNIDLVSYCGFYCGACPKYTKGQCEGCKGDNSKCAVGYKACQVRPCCIENGYNSCADCSKFESVKETKTGKLTKSPTTCAWLMTRALR